MDPFGSDCLAKGDIESQVTLLVCNLFGCSADWRPGRGRQKINGAMPFVDPATFESSSRSYLTRMTIYLDNRGALGEPHCRGSQVACRSIVAHVDPQSFVPGFPIPRPQAGSGVSSACSFSAPITRRRSGSANGSNSWLVRLTQSASVEGSNATPGLHLKGQMRFSSLES